MARAGKDYGLGLPVDDIFTTVPAWIGPPPSLPTPAAVASSAGIFDVFRVAPDRTLRWNHFNGTIWGDWQGLGGMLASGPGAVLLDDGHVQVFAVGMDGALWYRTYDGSWDAWQWVALDGMDPAVTIVSAPTPVQLATGEVRVYGRGSDDFLWQVTYDGTWGTWSKGGGDTGLQTGSGRSQLRLRVFRIGCRRQHAGKQRRWVHLERF